MSRPVLSRRIELRSRAVQVVDAPPGMRVKVLYGDLWLTAQGDWRDHFLASGDEVALAARRRTLIESFGPAWIEISAPLARGPLQCVADALRTWFGRNAARAQTLNRKCITSPSRTM